MAGEFLHGVEAIEIDEAPQPIRTVRSAVVGIVGAAVDKAQPGRHDVPILIRGTKAAAATAFGPGTLLDAIYSVLDHVSTLIVAVNVFDPTKHFGSFSDPQEVTLVDGAVDVAGIPAGADIEVRSKDLATLYGVGDATAHLSWDGMTLNRNAVAGAPAAAAELSFRYREPDPAGADEDAAAGSVSKATGARTGVHALLGAESVTGYRPRILIAPGYSGVGAAAPAGIALEAIARRMRAVAIVDGPNTTDAEAIVHRKLFDSRRVYIVDPHVRVSGGEAAAEPLSARAAGVLARSDVERGFWHSPSNREIEGVVGTARPIDFALGDTESAANVLNENQITTVIRAPNGGFRLWGNRAAVDPASKWTFLSVGRTMDLINDSLERAHFWAVDRNITNTYLEAVADNVNGYLAMLRAIGAIRYGSCVPSALNTPKTRHAGHSLFDIEFEPYTPSERITFRSRVVMADGSAEEIAA